MTLSLSVLGRNPEVLGGSPFQLNIAIDSALVQLLQGAARIGDARAVIESATGTQQ
jgi:hypothetical protein